MLKDALTLSALVAAVLLVRAAFKNRVPKRLLYALWLVVLLKLCLPGTAYALPLLPAEQTAAARQTETPAQSLPRRADPGGLSDRGRGADRRGVSSSCATS